MSLFISKLISSILQIIAFSLIPFIWWLLTARKAERFGHWIGLKKPAAGWGRSILYWIAGVSTAFLLSGGWMLTMLKNVPTAASEFRGLGLQALPAVMIHAILHTALPEEIVFRGFLLKRLGAKFGFPVANMVQAVLFGLLHGIMFFALAEIIQVIVITLFTGGIGWCMGYVNEKKADGSIIPSWIIHAVSNLFSGICSAFLLI